MTLAAIKYPAIRENLAQLMCHSLVTANLHYQMAIKSDTVSSLSYVENVQVTFG